MNAANRNVKQDNYVRDLLGCRSSTYVSNRNIGRRFLKRANKLRLPLVNQPPVKQLRSGMITSILCRNSSSDCSNYLFANRDKYNNDVNHDMMFDVYILPIIVKLCDEQNKKYPSKILHNRKWEGPSIRYCEGNFEGSLINNQHHSRANQEQSFAYKHDTSVALINNKIAMIKNKVNLKVEGQTFEALIDTGATLSVISEHAISQLKLIPLEPTDLSEINSCTLANGTEIPIKHKVMLSVTLGSTTIKTKFYILTNSYIDVIIGCDVLEQIGANIDFKTGQLTLTNLGTIRTNKANGPGNLGYITTRDLVTLSTKDSYVIEPKSRRRIVLKASTSIVPKDFDNKTIDIHEPLTVQLQTQYHNSSELSEIVTIVQNDDCKPQCLLADQTIMTITESNINVNKKDEHSKSSNWVSESIDLTEADLNDNQKQIVKELLNKFQDVFADNSGEIGCTNLLTYDIRLKPNTKPIRMRPYKTGWKQRELIEDQVTEWLDNGIIKPSLSEWSFPCLLVAKKGTDKQRLVVDFRSLNAQSELPNYPLLDLEDFLADLGHQKSNFYTTIDLKSAYLQVPLSERSQELCSFVCSKGQFSFLRAPYGLCALPLVFARLIDEVLRDTKHKYTQSFLDDILIYSSTFEEHVLHIQDVLKRLRKAGLTVEPRKTHIARKEIVFIGYTFSKYGIQTDPSNINKVKNFPIPKTVRDIKSFLGLCNYYRRFIQSYAEIARPLNTLLKKDLKFSWTAEANAAFENLRERLITSPILAFPDLSSNEPLRLTCDASLFGSGFVLSQYQPDQVTGSLTERAIAYGSRNFTETQKRYTVTERELLAVVFAVEKLDQYLRCKKFVIITDHSSLQWLLSKSLSNINARLARWVLGLGQYNFTIIHRPGLAIGNADSLSRLQCDDAKEDISFALEPYINTLRSGKQHTTNDTQNTIQDNETMGFALPGLENFTMDNLQEAQQNDYWYGAIRNYLIKNELPSAKKLAQKVLANHQEYIIINNILYHLWSSKGNSTDIVQQICITEEFKELIWKAMHVIPHSGHMGITKTYAKLRNRYFWPKMSAETSEFVQQCHICLQANLGQQTKIPLQAVPPLPTGPLEHLNLDLLRISTPSKGYNYILVIVCQFSKYLVARPLRNKSSKNLAVAFFQHYIQIFGLPKTLTITQDNGMENRGVFTATLHKLLGIRTLFTTTYRPESNGQVERFNRTILSILNRYAMKEPNKWANYLQYAVMAINSSISETTKLSAYEVLHGIKMLEPIDLQIKQPPKFVAKNHQEAYQYWSTQLKKIRDLARDRLFKSKVTQKRNYDKSTKPSNLKVGDVVYVKRTVLGLNEDPKIRPRFTGPYVIQRLLSPTNAILVDKKTNTRLPRSLHINKLKKIRAPRIRPTNKNEVSKEPITPPINTNEVSKEPITQAITQPINTNEVSKESNTEAHNTTQTEIQNAIPINNTPLPQHKVNINLPAPVLEVSEDEPREAELISKNEQPQEGSIILPPESSQDSFVANAPTESYMEEQLNNDTQDREEHTLKQEIYHPIKKVHRQRCTPEGDKEFYVSWKNRPKKDNCWISENNFTEELKEKVQKLKIPETKGSMRQLEKNQE